MTTAEKKAAKEKLETAEYFAKIMVRIGDLIDIRTDDGLYARFQLRGWRNGYMQDESGYEYHPIHVKKVNGHNVNFYGSTELLYPILQLIKAGHPDFLLKKGETYPDYVLKHKHPLPLPTGIKFYATSENQGTSKPVKLELIMAKVHKCPEDGLPYEYGFQSVKLGFLEGADMAPGMNSI